MMRERSHATASAWAQVHAYFTELCQHLAAGPEPTPTLSDAAQEDAAETVFRMLTQRDFTYLTRKRCEPYRPSVEAYLRQAIAQDEPIRLYYDVGGGYRASLQPGQLPPAFTPGLGELLALSQIRTFVQRTQPHCPVPIRFTLVVDNLCARYVNHIPVERTEHYAAALRAILRHFAFTDVDVLVESEQVAPAAYGRDFEAALSEAQAPDALTPAAHANVERFNGRRMGSEEARQYIARYSAGSATTEAGLARIVDGVRLTQRATPDTLAFRPFPGGDQRIQCGEVGLAMRDDGRLSPTLLSSANYMQYHSEQVNVSEWSIPHVEAIRVLY